MLVENLKKHYLILIILLAASFLRIYGIMDRGLVLWDSYLYANIAKTPLYVLEYIYEYWNDLSSSGMIQYLKENGCVFFGEKPGHTFLIFISFCILGVKEWAVLFPMALCGIASVFLTYIIGYRFFSKEVGLIGACILSLSGFQVAISRTGYPQADTMLIVLFAIYFYFSYKENREIRNLYFLGISLSLGTFFHPSFFIVIIPIILDFIFDVIKNKNFRPTKKQISILFLFIFCPLLIEEIIFFISSVLYDDTVPGSILAIFQKKQMFEETNKSANFFEGLIFYYKIIRDTDGLIWINIYILGTILCIFLYYKKMTHRVGIVLFQILIPFIFWPWKYPTLKTLCVTYPAFALVTGYSIWYFINNSKHQKILLNLTLILIISSTNYIFLFKQINIKTTYKDIVYKTAEIIKENGGYLSAENQKNWSMILKYLIPLVNNGQNGIEIRNIDEKEYKIIDYRQMISHKEYVDEIRQKGELVLKFKIYDRLFPVSHYHRLKEDGYQYIKDNFSEDWLYLYVYSIKL